MERATLLDLPDPLDSHEDGSGGPAATCASARVDRSGGRKYSTVKRYSQGCLAL